jgi:hypothetical protein
LCFAGEFGCILPSWCDDGSISGGPSSRNEFNNQAVMRTELNMPQCGILFALALEIDVLKNYLKADAKFKKSNWI